MSPLFTSTHLANTCFHLGPARTHVSIVYQHPPSTHPWLHCSPSPTEGTHMSPSLASTNPCLHCLPAPTQRTHMSPFLASTHPAHTHVSISGQQTPTNAYQCHCCVSPGRGLSTSSGPKLVTLQICRGRRGFLLVIYTMNQEPQDDEKKKTTSKISPLGPPYAAQGPIAPSL